jgi:tetratricopeptide (TPR) repeat protein
MLVTGLSGLFKYLPFLFIYLFPSKLNSQVYPDFKVDSLLKAGINYIVTQNYDEARLTFQSLDANYSHLPLGKIYLAATEIAFAYDFEVPFNENYIEINLEKAQNQVEKILESNQSDKWNVYFFALSRGYAAYYTALKGNWFDAFRTGLSSVSAFEECLELDPDFHEAWIAIGTYEYWKSRKTEFFSWLPFVSDNRDLGIEQLRHAIDSSVYNSHIAIHSLIWIYIDREDFNAALDLSEFAVEKFPESRIFKWGLARSYEEIDIKKAIQIYFEILKSYEFSGIESIVNVITIKHIIAQQYVKIGNNEKAKQLCLEILEINDLNNFEKEKLDDRLERVNTLLKNLN